MHARSNVPLDQLLAIHTRAHGATSHKKTDVHVSLKSWRDHKLLAKFYASLNTQLKTHVRIGGHLRSTYHLIGYTGFSLSLLVSCVLAEMNNLSILLCLMLSITCALVTRGLAYVSARWLGKPNIVFLRYFWVVVMLASFLLWYLEYPVIPYIEILILGIGIMLAFGRLGCLVAGCCHGRPATHGIRYGSAHIRDGLPPSFATCPLVPIQLVEHVWVLCILGISFVWYSNTPGTGSAMVFFVLAYSLGRFLLEFFRGDPERALRGPLSEPQWTSLLNVAFFTLLALADYIPFQLPHLLVTLALAWALIYAIWTQRWLGTPKYFTPTQYIEIGKGLEILRKSAGMAVIDEDSRPESVHIKTFWETLHISALQYPFDKSGHLHYTISSSNLKLTLKEAVSIARLILAFGDNNSSNYVIKYSKTGIFQLISLT